MYIHSLTGAEQPIYIYIYIHTYIYGKAIQSWGPLPSRCAANDGSGTAPPGPGPRGMEAAPCLSGLGSLCRMQSLGRSVCRPCRAVCPSASLSVCMHMKCMYARMCIYFLQPTASPIMTCHLHPGVHPLHANSAHSTCDAEAHWVHKRERTSARFETLKHVACELRSRESAIPRKEAAAPGTQLLQRGPHCSKCTVFHPAFWHYQSSSSKCPLLDRGWSLADALSNPAGL